MVAGEPEELSQSEDACTLAPPVGLLVESTSGFSSMSTHMPTENFAVFATWMVVCPCTASVARVVPQFVGVLPNKQPAQPQVQLGDGDIKTTPAPCEHGDTLVDVTPQLAPSVVLLIVQS